MPAASRSSVEFKNKADALADFIAHIEIGGQKADATLVFHAVRQLPYLSTGDRSIEGILQRRAGSCSSKHILLAALLNHIGIKANVELVLGDFAAPLRAAHNLPSTIMDSADVGIRDIHNIVRAHIDGQSVILDATWHDDVKPFGFRVNDSWLRQGDTQIAVDVSQMLGPAIEPAKAKAQIIASWPEAEQQKRRQFLENINQWVASVTPQH